MFPLWKKKTTTNLCSFTWTKMNNSQKNKKAPVCCGKEAIWVVNSFTLQYWYCRQCKNEVKEEEELPKGSTFNGSSRGGGGWGSGAVWLAQAFGKTDIELIDHLPMLHVYVGKDGAYWTEEYLQTNGYKVIKIK